MPPVPMRQPDAPQPMSRTSWRRRGQRRRTGWRATASTRRRSATRRSTGASRRRRRGDACRRRQHDPRAGAAGRGSHRTRASLGSAQYRHVAIPDRSPPITASPCRAARARPAWSARASMPGSQRLSPASTPWAPGRSGSGLSNNALTGSANTLNLGYGNQLDRYKANQQQSSGWGSALGLIGGIGLKLGMTRRWPGGAYSAACSRKAAAPDPAEGPPGMPIPEEASPSRGQRHRRRAGAGHARRVHRPQGDGAVARREALPEADHEITRGEGPGSGTSSRAGGPGGRTDRVEPRCRGAASLLHTTAGIAAEFKVRRSHRYPPSRELQTADGSTGFAAF